MIPDLREIPYEERLKKLRLWTMAERRNRADLIEVFKMSKGLSKLPFEDFFEISKHGKTRGHTLKLTKRRCRLDTRKYFVAERAATRWNSLDQKIIEQGSLNGFKTNLERLRKEKMGFFMD